MVEVLARFAAWAMMGLSAVACMFIWIANTGGSIGETVVAIALTAGLFVGGCVLWLLAIIADRLEQLVKRWDRLHPPPPRPQQATTPAASIPPPAPLPVHVRRNSSETP